LSRRDFSTQRRERRRAPGELALLAAGVLALASAAVLARRASGTEGRERAALERARVELEQLRGRAAVLEAGRAGANALAAGRIRLTATAPPARVLTELAAMMPPGVRLQSLSLAYGAELTLDLQLEAQATRGYDLFLERAASSPLLRELVPDPELRGAEVRGGLTALWSEATP
jgi:hypothetical protein